MFQLASENNSLIFLADKQSELANVVQIYTQSGFVQLQEFFSQEQISGLIKELKQATDREETVSPSGVISLSSCKKIFSDGQKMRDLISYSKQTAILQKLVGSSFWVHWDETISNTLSQENKKSSLRDNDFQIWVCLSRSTSSSDKLWVVPGSHKQMNDRDSGSLVSPVALETQPGDLVVVSPQAIRFTSQRTKDPKRFLGFMLSSMVQ